MDLPLISILLTLLLITKMGDRTPQYNNNLLITLVAGFAINSLRYSNQKSIQTTTMR
jgi:hypothetical protein